MTFKPPPTLPYSTPTLIISHLINISTFSRNHLNILPSSFFVGDSVTEHHRSARLGSVIEMFNATMHLPSFTAHDGPGGNHKEGKLTYPDLSRSSQLCTSSHLSSYLCTSYHILSCISSSIYPPPLNVLLHYHPFPPNLFFSPPPLPPMRFYSH